MGINKKGRLTASQGLRIIMVFYQERRECDFLLVLMLTIVRDTPKKSLYLNNLNHKEKMSNGFQNNSLLGSSTGFKKRNLLRPASGMLNKRLEFLRAVDISQSQPAIASLIRSEVANIEQQINILDKDRRIRQSEGGLQKGYVTALRKWLQGGQTLADKEDDQVKILKQLGADSFQSGFKKLWKVACNLDLMITKITELQIVHFLLYDQMFVEIGKDSLKSSGVLSSISNNGYTSGTFQITQVLLDRTKDVYAATKKGGSNVRETKGRDETGELIAQLKSENAKLTSLLDKLSAERQQDKLREAAKQSSAPQKKQTSFLTSSEGSHNPKQVFAEIEQKYKEQINYLTSEKARADASVVELKVKISSLQSQVKANAISFKLPTGNVPKSGSYQQALMQEMQKMKRGFEKKIATLTDEFAGRERELRKKEADYKSENEKIKWEKGLLLKKFQFIPQK